MQKWAPEELTGGIPGKGISDAHDLLGAALQSNAAVTGCKADIRRCFDSVSPTAAIRAWRYLGAPSSLLSVLEAFYKGQQRWITYGGYWQQTPIQPRTGLLQGCPLSTGLLNGVMAVWVGHVRVRAPRGLALYLDDRAMWSLQKGSLAREELKSAVEAGRGVDEAAGLRPHPGKAASFSSTSAGRATLRHHPDLGEVLTEFPLLGVGGTVLAGHAQAMQELCSGI